MMFDLEGAIPIEYDAENTYLVSNSQYITGEDCKKKWNMKYYHRKKGETVRFFPFDYGNLVHPVMEKTMMLPSGQRMTKIYEFGMDMSSNYPQKFQKKLIKALPTMSQRVLRYDSVTPERSTELKTAFRAPSHWFNPKLYEALKTRKIAVGGDDQSFDHFGFRGIIDYYGFETKSNDIVALDWKSGKYKAKYVKKYIKQINSYGFSGAVNNMIPKKLVIEFVEMETNLNNHNVVIPFDFEVAKAHIKHTLQTISNYIIQSYVDVKFGKPLITYEGNNPCEVCEFAPHCKLNDNPLMRDYYKAAALQRW